MVSFARLAFLSACRPSPAASASAAAAAAAALSASTAPPRHPSRRLLAGGLASAALALANPASTSCVAPPSPLSTTARAMSGAASPPSASSPPSIPASDSDPTGYLNAEDSASLDADLMSTPGFSLEQLMELAGLSVAEAVYAVVPPPGRGILLVCGPGNNGGDGLVAARHLVLFGYDCKVVYPKRSKKQHFINLVRQCEDVGVEVLDGMPSDAVGGRYDAIVDAVFGFSFKGEPREPFASALEVMAEAQGKEEERGAGGRGGTVVISVDVPSGWDVNDGDVSGTGFNPDVLVSLTAPKLCAKSFKGRHFVGGRFVPPAISDKYGVKMPPYPGVSQMPPYPGVSQVVEMRRVEDWQVQYAEYLAEKEGEEFARYEREQRAPMTAKDEEDWAVEYYRYLAEKEGRARMEEAGLE